MYYKIKLIASLLLVMALFSFKIDAQTTAPSGTDVPRILSYQGQISSSEGNPVNGTHQIIATLYSDANGKHSIWHGSFTAEVTKGVFTVLLGSGKSKLPESTELNRSLWIGIAVDGGDEMKPLTQLLAAPYALNVPDKSITAAKLADDVLLGSHTPTIQATPNWTRTGDPYSAAGGDVLGTAGGGAGGLQMVVQGTTIMRYNATTGTPDIIGGDGTNGIISSVGSTIAGGGSSSSPDSIIYSHYSTIGGGNGNRIDSIDANNHDCATVAGGCSNSAYGADATVAGGGGNYAGKAGFVGGGTDNSANPTNSITDNNGGVVGGGYFNVADNQFATVGGGQVCKVYAPSATVAGGNYNVINLGAEAGAIGGGEHNTLATNKDHTTIAGGYYNLASGVYAAITGGSANIASGDYSFDGGGRSDTVKGNFSVNGGGQDNLLTSAADHTFIGGGQANKDSSDHTVLAGGNGNIIQPSAFESVLVGGETNLIKSGGAMGFIGSGKNNTINNGNAVIGGGENNVIDAGGGNHWNVIGGGWSDSILTGAVFGVIGGGALSTVKAGAGTIGGGYANAITAGGNIATIPGGDSLIAQSYAQTAIGFSNIAKGSQSRTSNISLVNEPLFLVGNGNHATGTRSNAFEVSYDGHSVVFDVNGPGTIPGGTSRPFILGGTYQDNVICSWGEITPPGNISGTENFGIAGVTHVPGSGSYQVVLNINDDAIPPNNITALTNASIVATLTGSDCNFIHTSAIQNVVWVPDGLTHPAFTITITHNILNAAHSALLCQNIDDGFKFIVVGRK